MKKDRILLFIPAYNCEDQVVRVLSQLEGEVLEYIDEVLVINNRSTDGTEEAVLSFKREHPEVPLKLLRNEENYGLGGSQKVAFSYAIENDFDYAIILHGDDQGNIRDFLPVFRKKYYVYYDSVLGARFMRGSRLEGYSMVRTLGNIVYDFLFAAVLKRRVFDLGSGLNLYDVRSLKNGYYKRFPDDLTFNYCMVMADGYYKHSVRFFPISWRETDQVSNVKLTSQAKKVLKMLFDYFKDPSSIEDEYRDKLVNEYRAEEIL